MKQLLVFFAALACAISLNPSPLSAQASTVLVPGARVKLITPSLEGSQQIVRVINASRDSVEFRSEAYPVTRTVAISDVTAIEVPHAGRRPFIRNMLVGAGVGAVAGGVIGYTTYKKPDCEIFCLFYTTRSGEATAAAIALGTIGLVVGAGFAAFQDGERWTRLPVNTSVSLHPAKGGRIALTIARAF
ncbi:MAG TPA: hypothetical protein VNJ04_19385 [Gemmatimonadaceae bacterium]|nr:hypothetical protein [Gemmatimonadaceae bacterium]